MKMIALVLSLCFTANVFAATGSVQALERAFDNYNYAVTVEWDQKDPTFHEQQTKKLIEDITTLRNNGLTRDEIVSVVEKKVADKKALEALKLKLSLLNITSPEDLSQALRESDLYTHGASWNGSAAMFIFPALFVVLVVYLIATDRDYECVRWETGYYCEQGNYMICGYGEHCAQYEERD
jgi:hypothetical protein